MALTGPREDADIGARSASDREIAHLSLNFVVELAAAGIAGLKPLDSVLVMAINQANIAPLTHDPAARSRYGALDAPAPDAERRPVSVRAVAASMRLPYETARRHVLRLAARGVCAISDEGAVVTEAFMRSEAYLEAARVGHERLFALHLDLRARGLLEPLPESNFPDEREPPIRGAVRLMSDYLLRTAEGVGARTGDLLSTLVLLPVLSAAAGAVEPDDAAGLRIAAIARRLHLPAETVRRHASGLVDAGLCAFGAAGLILADPSLTEPTWRNLLRDNAIAVQRLFAGLAERGVIDAWRRIAAGS